MGCDLCPVQLAWQAGRGRELRGDRRSRRLCPTETYVDRRSGHPSPVLQVTLLSLPPRVPARSRTCQVLFLTLEVGRARPGPCPAALRLVRETQR